MKELFELLIQNGGQIVSSNNCSTFEINQARASDRMFVDENSFGFIWIPEIDMCTMEGVEALEKWYPEAVELPEKFKNADWLFKILNKAK
jgi:hypothetical protein